MIQLQCSQEVFTGKCAYIELCAEKVHELSTILCGGN